MKTRYNVFRKYANDVFDEYIGKKRVVFTKSKDPLSGIEGYRFVGFFIGDHYNENGTITHKRIDDKFKIIKK